MLQEIDGEYWKSKHIIVVCDICGDYVDARTIDESEAISSSQSLGWYEHIEMGKVSHYCEECLKILLDKK